MLTINKNAIKISFFILITFCLFFVVHFSTLEETNIVKNTKNYEIENIDLKYPNQTVFLKNGETIEVDEVLISETSDISLIRVEKELKDIFGISTPKYEWILYIPSSISTIA